MMIVSVYALYGSWGWPWRSALFPQVIALCLLVLALLQVVLSAFGLEKVSGGPAVDFELTAPVDPALARKRTVIIFGWIIGFFFVIVLVGFPAAVPLFVFLYLKFGGKEGWGLSLLLAALAWLFMHGLFDRLLHIRFSQGWLFAVLEQIVPR